MSETHIQSDQQYKAGVRREWAMAAPGWERWFETTESEHAGRVITQALLDAAKLKAGDVVLDVGAGYGEPGLSAAAAVGPTGHVTCLDISGDMLAFAERRARQAGLRNVDFVEADIETDATRTELVRCSSQPRRAHVRERSAGHAPPSQRISAPRRLHRDRRLGQSRSSGLRRSRRGDDRDGRHRPSAARPRAVRARRGRAAR